MARILQEYLIQNPVYLTVKLLAFARFMYNQVVSPSVCFKVYDESEIISPCIHKRKNIYS